MSKIACPVCGNWRTVENYFTLDGWENRKCYSCGDPGWLNPFDADDPLEGRNPTATTILKENDNVEQEEASRWSDGEAPPEALLRLHELMVAVVEGTRSLPTPLEVSRKA